MYICLNTLCGNVLKGIFNGPQSTYCGQKCFIYNTGRPLQIFASGGVSTHFYKIVFVGSYRLTTYCEGLTAAASDLSKMRTWSTWVHVGGSSNLKEGFAMLFVNTLFNLDEIHFNMSNTLTNFRGDLFQWNLCKNIQNNPLFTISVITSYESRIK